MEVKIKLFRISNVSSKQNAVNVHVKIYELKILETFCYLEIPFSGYKDIRVECLWGKSNAINHLFNRRQSEEFSNIMLPDTEIPLPDDDRPSNALEYFTDLELILDMIDKIQDTDCIGFEKDFEHYTEVLTR